MTTQDVLGLINSGGGVALAVVVYMELRLLRGELRVLRDVLVQVATGSRLVHPSPVPSPE